MMVDMLLQRNMLQLFLLIILLLKEEPCTQIPTFNQSRYFQDYIVHFWILKPNFEITHPILQEIIYTEAYFINAL